MGGSLPAGSSISADQTRSDVGVKVSGIVSTPGAAVTWTVKAADTPGGTETQVFRAVTYDVTGVSIAPPHPGTLFYRICLANTTRSPVSFSHVSTVPRTGAGNGQSNVGPTTAILGPGGTACGELIKGSGRLTVSSDVPVTWWVRAFNGDLSVLRQIRPLTVTAPSVDQAVGPGPYAFLDACVINHSTRSATLSMQFAAS